MPSCSQFCPISMSGAGYPPMYLTALSIMFCRTSVRRRRSPRTVGWTGWVRTMTRPATSNRPRTISRASFTRLAKGMSSGSFIIRPIDDIHVQELVTQDRKGNQSCADDIRRYVDAIGTQGIRWQTTFIIRIPLSINVISATRIGYKSNVHPIVEATRCAAPSNGGVTKKGDPLGRPYKLSLQHSILHSVRSEVFAEFLLHHRFVIGPVADVHLCHGITFEDD